MRDQLTFEQEEMIEQLELQGCSRASAYQRVILGYPDPMESEDDNRLRSDALPGYDAWKTDSGREGTE